MPSMLSTSPCAEHVEHSEHSGSATGEKHLWQAAASKRLKASPDFAVEQCLIFVALLGGVPVRPVMQRK